MGTGVLNQVNPIILKDVDFRKALREDRENDYKLHRMGVRGETNYTISDGQWREVNNDVMIWEASFNGPKASSLSVRMENVYLPDNTLMYLYSNEHNIVHGPIDARAVYNGIYISDFLKGKKLQIVITSTRKNYQEIELSITSVSQGIKDYNKLHENATRAFGDAQSCNFDIGCSIANGWDDESDATGLLITENGGMCTATLINNTCNELRPYVLTAFHCIDRNGDGTISATDQVNTVYYLMRFKYESSSPQCSGTSSGNDGSGNWITIPSFLFRSANSDSDFALLEAAIIFPSFYKGLALAGWDKSSSISTSGVYGIHHPSGDAKKFSYDSSTPVSASNLINEAWQIDTWTDGTVEVGSSGSPLFNSSHRIIGQLRGPDSLVNSGNYCDLNHGATYGKFSSSWTGGGTAATRLSSWLDEAGLGSTITNTILYPYLESHDEVCTTNKTFTIVNPIPGRAITWSVSPSGLFATTSGASISGTTSNAVLRAKNSSSSGEATITFTMLSPTGSCNDVVFTKTFWLGKPKMPKTNPTRFFGLGLGQSIHIYLTESDGATSNTATWSASGGVTLVGGSPTGAWKEFDATSMSTGYVNVTTTNVCGNSQPRVNYIWIYSPLIVYPSINDGHFTVEKEVTVSLNRSVTKDKIKVYNQFGNLVYVKDLNNSKTMINLSKLPNGVYIVQTEVDNNMDSKKIIIQK